MFGTALTIADGVFTPAVSVTSAVQGIAVAKPSVENDVVPISIVGRLDFQNTVVLCSKLHAGPPHRTVLGPEPWYCTTRFLVCSMSVDNAMHMYRLLTVFCSCLCLVVLDRRHGDRKHCSISWCLEGVRSLQGHHV